MRYELSDGEWTATKPMLPNRPRGVPRVNDRRVEHDLLRKTATHPGSGSRTHFSGPCSPELRADDREGAGAGRRTRCVAAKQHAGERTLRREARQPQPCANVGLGVREVDVDRAAMRCERARQQARAVASSSAISGPSCVGRTAVAAEQEAGDAAVPLGEQLGRRQAAARSRPSTAPRSAPNDRARRRRTSAGHTASSIGWMRSAFGGTRSIAASPAVREPRANPSRPEIRAPGRPCVRPASRRAPATSPAAVRSAMQRRSSRVAKPAPAIAPGHQHHADPGEAAAIRQRRGGRDHRARRVAHRVDRAEIEEDAPVGGDLVPAGLGDERLGIAELGRRRAASRSRASDQKAPSRVS